MSGSESSFVVEWDATVYGRTVVYASDEQEARERARGSFDPLTDGDDYEDKRIVEARPE